MMLDIYKYRYYVAMKKFWLRKLPDLNDEKLMMSERTFRRKLLWHQDEDEWIDLYGASFLMYVAIIQYELPGYGKSSKAFSLLVPV